MCDIKVEIIEDICAYDESVKIIAHTLYSNICRRKHNSQDFLSYIDLIKIYHDANSSKCRNVSYEIEFENRSLWTAVQVLCNPRIDLLELTYLFIDELDNSYPLSLSDVVEAQKFDSLEHPFTGELIEDYKSHVFPFFKVHYESLRKI